MSRSLVPHAHFHIFSFVSPDSLRTKLPSKLPCKLGIARKDPRLQHGGLCAHIAFGRSDRFFERARGVSHLEAAVPKKIKNLLHHLLQMWRDPLRPMLMQKHHVDVTERVELTPAVSAKCDQGK